MTTRSTPLQSFIDAAATAFGDHAKDVQARRSVEAIVRSLRTPAEGQATDRDFAKGQRLPACEHLKQTLIAPRSNLSLSHLIDAFEAIEPSLIWRRRSSGDTASINFPNGHANAMIVGPGGYEERQDVWLGATLMAPNVRYPDHTHAPEEVYLVLSPGEFRQGFGPWFSPGIGGSFYNEPGILHAMRSLEQPFLAFWALRSRPTEATLE